MKTPFSLDSVIATFVPLWAMALKKFRQDTLIVFQRARCKNDEFRFYQIVAGKTRLDKPKLNLRRKPI